MTLEVEKKPSVESWICLLHSISNENHRDILHPRDNTEPVRCVNKSHPNRAKKIVWRLSQDCVGVLCFSQKNKKKNKANKLFSSDFPSLPVMRGVEHLL